MDSTNYATLYTPEAQIPIARIFAEDGVIYLRFKKPQKQIYETVTLDQLVLMIGETIQRQQQAYYM